MCEFVPEAAEDPGFSLPLYSPGLEKVLLVGGTGHFKAVVGCMVSSIQGRVQPLIIMQ